MRTISMPENLFQTDCDDFAHSNDKIRITQLLHAHYEAVEMDVHGPILIIF